MTQPPRIQAVSYEGTLPKFQKVEAETSPVRECAARWKSQQEEFLGKPWAQCPPEMTADFLRSMAREMLQNDGEQASARASLFTASIMAEQSIEHLRLYARCPAVNACIELDARIMAASPRGEDQAAFSLAVDPESSDEEILDALGALGDTPAFDGKLFDPIAHIPDTEAASLVAQAEKAINASSLEAIVVAAAALLTWDKMETMHAKTSRLQLGGLTSGGEDVLPDDQCVVFEARSHGLEASYDSATPTMRHVSVRVPR